MYIVITKQANIIDSSMVRKAMHTY